MLRASNFLFLMLLNLALLGAATFPRGARAAEPAAPGRPTIAAYYFPNYHVDPRNEKRHGKGWTEWDLVRLALPRFAGHQQPKVPAWGYEDEADPKVMRKKIEAAASHGIDAFIFDWYYYDDGPYLNRPLDEAFLKVDRDARLKFALMWANHNWIDIHPAKAHAKPEQQFPGKFTPATWERATDFIAKNYFTHPGYWTIDGRAYFSIYEIDKLVASFGSIAATRQALDRFDEKARQAGLKGIHFNIVFWGKPILPGETAPADPDKLIKELGCRSVSSYVWIHHVALDERQIRMAVEMRELDGIPVQIVVDDDLVGVDQLLGEMRADESGAAGDEDPLAGESHGVYPFRRLRVLAVVRF
jgi:hypothetical protein